MIAGLEKLVSRWEPLAALAVAALALAVMALRAASAISFGEPLQLATSGYEQESLLAIWERLHGRPIYVSRWDEPFRWAIYNWLYYDTYAAFAGTVMSLLALGDEWLPTTTRLLTVSGMALGVFGAFASYRAVAAPAGRGENGVYWALSVLVGAGPLIGYWGITTRPDVWAMTLEIFAVLAFWRLVGARPLTAILVFCVFAYAAWAFKQSSVTAVGALGLLFLARRRWRDLALLVTVMVSAWALTLAIGPEIYRASILLSEYQSINTLTNSWRILVAAVPKVLPVALGFGVIAILLFARPTLRRAMWADDGSVFALAGLGCGAVLAFATSAQPGAAENYYFPPLFFATLFVVTVTRLCRDAYPSDDALARAGRTLGWVLQGGALAAVLLGFIGTTSVRHFHAYHIAMKSCLDVLPRPLFVDSHYLSLPWMTPNNPSYVLAFGYREDRLAGRENYRGNGVGGKIGRGEFAALAFTNDPEGRYDGAALTHYRHADSECADLMVYLRKQDS